MGVGALVDLVVTVLAAALVAVIAFLIKGWVDSLLSGLRGVAADVRTNTDRLQKVERDVVRLTEAQRAVVNNQGAHSKVAERILDESDELQDKVSQLDHATSRLYDRLAAHDTYLAVLRGDGPVGG